MTAIHFISSGKGNVGKSTFASFLAHLADRAGADPLLVDGDCQRQTFYRYLGSRVKTVVLSDDPALESQPDTIWYLVEKEDRDVIVDLGAQTDIIVNRWLDERSIYDSAQELGVEIYKWWVADLDKDSLNEVALLAQNIPAVKHVLVKNLDCAKAPAWRATVKGNPALSEALSRNLQSIQFPRLFGTLVESLREQRVTFQDVIGDRNHEIIGMLDRGTILKWIKACEAEVTPIYAFQKPPPMAKANQSE